MAPQVHVPLKELMSVPEYAPQLFSFTAMSAGHWITSFSHWSQDHLQAHSHVAGYERDQAGLGEWKGSLADLRRALRDLTSLECVSKTRWGRWGLD